MAQMEIDVNGDKRLVAAGLTVRDLLTDLGLAGNQRIAVERNLEIVPQAEWDALELEAGDRIEIVNIVGGG